MGISRVGWYGLSCRKNGKYEFCVDIINSRVVEGIAQGSDSGGVNKVSGSGKTENRGIGFPVDYLPGISLGRDLEAVVDSRVLDNHIIFRRGKSGSNIGAVSYTHLTLPTNREV